MAVHGEPIDYEDPGTYVYAQNIVGRQEIARRLETQLTTVNRWIERRESTNFPVPVTKVGTADIYDYAQVEGWHQAWVMTRRRRDAWT